MPTHACFEITCTHVLNFHITTFHITSFQKTKTKLRMRIHAILAQFLTQHILPTHHMQPNKKIKLFS